MNVIVRHTGYGCHNTQARTHAHAHTHTRTHTRMHTRTRTHTHTRTHARMHARTHAHTHTHTTHSYTLNVVEYETVESKVNVSSHSSEEGGANISVLWEGQVHIYIFQLLCALLFDMSECWMEIASCIANASPNSKSSYVFCRNI